MNVNKLVDVLANSCYGLLTLNFLWGLFCVVLLWRRVAYLRFRSEKDQMKFLNELEGHLDARNFDAAAQLCEDDHRALPQLVHTVITIRGLGYEQLRQMVAELMQRDVMAKLEYRLSWVATVIKAGPLLGLFGTVLGMMAAFGRLGTGEKVQPSQIAAEISVALICTAMGLATAIPFNYILASLSIRLRMLQESLSFGLSSFLEHCKSMQAKTATGRAGAWK